MKNEKSLQILVVEDEYIEFAKKAINKVKGIRVSYNSNLEEAIDSVNSQEFDLVITDMYFPRKTMLERNMKVKNRLMPAYGEFDTQLPSGVILQEILEKMKIPYQVYSQTSTHGTWLQDLRYSDLGKEMGLGDCITLIAPVSEDEEQRNPKEQLELWKGVLGVIAYRLRKDGFLKYFERKGYDKEKVRKVGNRLSKIVGEDPELFRRFLLG